MKMLKYQKDTEAYCHGCGALVFVFCRDIFSGDLVESASIYPDKGQAPWQYAERLVCRNCKLALNERFLDFKLPEGE